jgi:hypothetical protein
VRRAMVGFAALAVLIVVTTAPATAAPPETARHIGGVVHARGLAAQAAAPVNNLTWHGGPVLHANTTFSIYWRPTGYSFGAGYIATINGFLKNVAAASGSSSNVYFSDGQYTDATGNAAYKSTFGGTFTDTNPFPANGCKDRYTPVCLTDAQIRTEISRVLTAKHWTPSLGKVFFLFTPKRVGSCFGSSCAFSTFCAYHGDFGPAAAPTIYTNQPYAAYVPAACDSDQHPNGNNADATINVLSHEHNEANTDPLLNAWYDSAGAENGDKCAWSFGTPLGSTSTGQYNQLIGTGKYYLQREWSNASSGCVLTGQ